MTSFFTKLENNKALVAVKEGMVLEIPTLMIGSIALLLKTFPMSSYQQFIYKELDGMIIDTLSLIHNTTLGIISLIILLSISYSYGKANKSEYSFIIPIVAMCSFLVFVGIGNLKNTIEVFNVNWIFTSIVIAITSSILFLKLTSCFSTKFKYYTEGADLGFNVVISSIIPFAIVVIVYSILHNILTDVFGEVNIQIMFLDIAFKLFDDMGRNLLSALVFIFLMHIMCFFGIHGSNVLDNVAKDLFQSGMQVNIDLMNNHKIPTEIFTKTFFDTMVLFGGFGTLLCLVIAIFVVGKRRSVKSLVKMALVPALFNMNEILVFGVPIVLNPSLFIPFILTPIVLTLTSYIAMYIGVVPYTVSPVEWTTPHIF